MQRHTPLLHPQEHVCLSPSQFCCQQCTDIHPAQACALAHEPSSSPATYITYKLLSINWSFTRQNLMKRKQCVSKRKCIMHLYQFQKQNKINFAVHKLLCKWWSRSHGLEIIGAVNCTNTHTHLDSYIYINRSHWTHKLYTYFHSHIWKYRLWKEEMHNLKQQI